MNIEKLKPWNWFKHEDDTSSQIPVTKQEAKDDIENASALAANGAGAASYNSAIGSLLQLHNDMDRWFDDVWRSFGMPASARLARATSSGFDRSSGVKGMPGNLDISGNGNAYEVAVDLPGYAEDDVSIELIGNTLTIKGEKDEKTESKDKQYYRIERSVGSIQRTLSLPEDASTEGIEAVLKNGLLNIHIPRKALPKSDVKKIDISS